MSQSVITPEVIVPNAITRDFSAPTVSPRYHHLTTMNVVDALSSDGWVVDKTAQARVRNAERQGFQKHFVWMRQAKIDLAVGDTELRLILMNAHDGTSAYRMMAGLHRKVCSNGLIISIGEFAYIGIRHTDEAIFEKAINGAKMIAETAPAIDAQIKKMQEIELTDAQRADFARKAVNLVWPDRSETPIESGQFLNARRAMDDGNSLWLTYNTIQENLIRGGMQGGRRATRAINSPIRDVNVNKMLFDLASTYTK